MSFGEFMGEKRKTPRGKKGSLATAKSKLKELEEKLREREKEKEDYLTRLQYLQAEFENYKKMVAKEKENLIRHANEGLIIELLDVYENLERAIESGGKAGDKNALLEGVKMTYNQFKEILEREGLSPIKSVGEKLDPFRHEVVMQEKREDCEEGTVLEELQRGYILKDKVIRYSKVKVSKR
jgi:molecular chaperone GrpE